jgi:hypothetical protein
MKTAIAALVIAAAVWCYPLAAEETIDPCDALASQALRIETRPDQDRHEAATVTLIRPLGDFAVAETVRRRYPSVPPGMVCTGYYWRLIADPDLVGRIASDGDAE